MNHVITKVEKWVSEHQPGRELQYLIFAYHTTVEPPLDSNGNPIISLHEKLRIYFAPISANYSVPLNSPLNKDTLQMPPVVSTQDLPILRKIWFSMMHSRAAS